MTSRSPGGYAAVSTLSSFVPMASASSCAAMSTLTDGRTSAVVNGLGRSAARASTSSGKPA